MSRWAGIRDVIAFWIFGLANNFAYVIMLSAAEDIIRKQSGGGGQDDGGHLPSNSSSSSSHCLKDLGKPRCLHLMSTGAVLMADILPALCLKFTLPFFMNRIPFGFRHFLVCSLQAFSYLTVAFSSSIQMSLLGVVFASASSGLGELCYLALSSHYTISSIAAWSSGTGGAGLVGALAYAALTEPKLFGLSPKNALLSMLVVPIIFAIVESTCLFLVKDNCPISYWFVLTPSVTVHKMSLMDPTTWLVPIEKSKKSGQSTIRSSSSSVAPATNDGEWPRQNEAIGNISAESGGRAVTHEFPLSQKLLLTLPLLRYMLPLSIVYFAEYLINSGLHQLIHFDCAHGFSLANASQFRWYQALYQFGVFTSRSSISLFELSPLALYLLPFLQCANLVIFYFQALDQFIPHIALIFLLIYIEGLFGGASYVNTFHRIHKEASVRVREFSMSIASSGDSMGISVASICSILLHNYICQLYPRVYP